MAVSMQCQVLHTYCIKKDRNKKPYKQNQNQITILSLPKSSPTQLVINQSPYPQTKLQALDKVVKELETSVKNGINIDDPHIFSSLLETCFHLDAVKQGIRIHHLIPEKLLRRNVGVSSKLLRLYATNGYIEEAHQVFDYMSERKSYAFAWNSLISGYSEMGMFEDALALYFQMVEEGVEPDNFTFPRVLKACGGMGLIHVGQEVHREIVRRGYANDLFVLNGLVDMYSKCGDIMRASKVFNKIAEKDLVSWNSMLTGYVKHGLLFDALVVFRRMMLDGYEPDSISISTILMAGLSLKLVAQIHGWVIRKGNEWNLPIVNSLIFVYSNHGRLDKARQVFDQMPERDLVSWNTIISVHNKHPNALEYFKCMLSANISPDAITFVSVLTACAHLRLVKDGERLFSTMTAEYEIVPSMEHYACLVNVYGRAGLITEAYKVIVERMQFAAGPTVWGALLHACYVHGNVEHGEIAAEKLFELEPDNDHNFKLLMQIYGKAGRMQDTERVKMMMVSRGFDL
uniref:pentatricopeptide repeat-containing protein At4g25270, chloroplastic n=1 Tax=Erigeron canadensis TaxID=72917 RepID=UPI001CB901C4|nr:pentatricopeptide repeat-containing protein At4g25270, chloroplastic [Erigeron canadensis]